VRGTALHRRLAARRNQPPVHGIRSEESASHGQLHDEPELDSVGRHSPKPGKYDRRNSIPYGPDLLALYGLSTRGRQLYREHKARGEEWDGVVSFRSTGEMLQAFGDPPTGRYYRRRMQSILRLWDAQIRIFEIVEPQGKAERRLYDKADLLKSVVAWSSWRTASLGCRSRT